ncbi:MAG: DUF4249 family protein [Bacteroidota bacterium]
MSYRNNRLYLSLLTLLLSCLLLSCEKEVKISLAGTPPSVVVQGAIETNLPPYVVLTSTISFFEKVDLKTLENSFLHNATITVADGSKTVPLKEYSFDTGSSSKFYVYSVDTANLANLMFGQVGRSYTLTITHGGATYTSVTTIPPVKGPDSVWFASPLFVRATTPANARQLFANYTDPDTMGNYVRYFTQRNGDRFFPSGLFSDEVVNGKVVNNIALYGGYDNTGEDINRDSLIYFFPGDSVTLKWAEIDKGVYKFWNTMQFAQNAVGNPFASPINVQSNISNGAVGVWAGYSSLLITRIAP